VLELHSIITVMDNWMFLSGHQDKQ